MQITQYYQNVERIKKDIQLVKEYAEYLKDKNSIEKLEELEKYITDEHFNLVVVGEFSRGKSSFVNAIIGKRILPSSKNPTTATLNVVENGISEPVYTIHYHNGKSKTVNEQEFKKIIAPELLSNEKSKQAEYVSKVGEIQKIKHIHIAVENELGKNGVTIIDTPGVNDLDSRREQITFNYIPKADAAVVILSATQQLTASENKFIQERILKNDISKLFIVINFKDILSNEADCQRVLSFVGEKLKSVVPSNRLFLVSAKEALAYKRKMNGENLKSDITVPASLEETGFVEMEAALYDFLANERGSIKLERFKAILNSVIKDILENTIEMHVQSIHMSKDELQQKIKELRPMIHRSRKRCENELENLKIELLMHQEALSKEYRKYLTAVAYKAKKAVENYSGTVPAEVYELISDETASMEKELQVDFPKRIQEKIEDVVKSSLNRMGDEFSEMGVHINLFDQMKHSGNIMTAGDAECLDVTERRRNNDADTGDLLELGYFAGSFVLGLTVGVAALPLVFIGGKLLEAYMDNQEENGQTGTEGNEPVITNVSLRRVFMSEINKLYFVPVEDKVKEFRVNYEKQILDLIKKIQIDCNKRLEQSIRQLELELEEKQCEQSSLEKEIENVEEMKQQLNAMLRR